MQVTFVEVNVFSVRKNETSARTATKSGQSALKSGLCTLSRQWKVMLLPITLWPGGKVVREVAAPDPELESKYCIGPSPPPFPVPLCNCPYKEKKKRKEKKKKSYVGKTVFCFVANGMLQ
ncbi:hypothetical protein SLA2020_288590 [Shorea laevis]